MAKLTIWRFGEDITEEPQWMLKGFLAWVKQGLSPVAVGLPPLVEVLPPEPDLE